LCVPGDQQTERVDYFETYAPVVQWSTIRTMHILSDACKWKSKQVDYELAFLHASLEDDVHVDMPRDFQQPRRFENLFESLYGLKQSPTNFFEHFKAKYFSQEFRQKHK